MKAFKQFDFKMEQRALWSYLSFLSLICCLIMFTPVFGQEVDSIEDKAHLKMEVEKEYDDNGNITGYDSSWNWHGGNNQHYDFKHDSVWTQFHEHWNRVFYDINSRDFFDSLNINQWADTMSFHFKNWGHNIEELLEEERFKPDKNTIDKWHKQHEEFTERFKKYHNEHKQLLKKYFYEYQNEDMDEEAKPQDIPKPTHKDKSGKI